MGVGANWVKDGFRAKDLFKGHSNVTSIKKSLREGFYKHADDFVKFSASRRDIRQWTSRGKEEQSVRVVESEFSGEEETRSRVSMAEESTKKDEQALCERVFSQEMMSRKKRSQFAQKGELKVLVSFWECLKIKSWIFCRA